jgi:D-beta-D-heptose 7-phosphate kinase/D-beta-D-heptose 1-phosphate adenosyltransferase
MSLDGRIPVLVDPKGKDWDRYRGATCVTPNTGELEAIAGSLDEGGEAGLVQAAERIREAYELKWILVTRGNQGMCLVGCGSPPLLVPARAREVFDVSGAGDTVIATLAAGLAAGLPIGDAAKVANIAAGIVVGKLGIHPVTRNELRTALQMNMNGTGSYYCGKVSTLDMARGMVKAWRNSGLRVIFTNGSFDLLHPGHIHLLHQARALGDRLIVALNTDRSVRRLKGPDRPILSESDRAVLLAALSCVDLVVLFDEDTPLSLIEGLRPDILVKGSNYRIDEVMGRELVEGYGGHVELVPVLKGYSTKMIVRKFRRRK